MLKSDIVCVILLVVASACSSSESAKAGDISRGGVQSAGAGAPNGQGGVTSGGATFVGMSGSTNGGSAADCGSQPIPLGAQWKKTNWTAETDFFDLYAGQNWVLARTWDSLNGGRVFLTRDSGDTWDQVSSAETDIDILSVATANGAVLAGTWNGLYQSTTGGDTWTPATSSGMPQDSGVQSIAAIGTSLYAGTPGGIYQSTDGGQTWADVSSGVPSGTMVTTIFGNASSVFVGTDKGGVLVAKSGTTTWATSNSGLTDAHIVQLAGTGNRIFAVTLNGSFVSEDNGASWVADESGLADINRLLVLNTQILAGTESSGVHVSSDGGGTFVTLGTGMPTDARVWSLAASGRSVFAATDSGIWRLNCSGH